MLIRFAIGPRHMGHSLERRRWSLCGIAIKTVINSPTVRACSLNPPPRSGLAVLVAPDAPAAVVADLIAKRHQLYGASFLGPLQGRADHASRPQLISPHF